MDPNIERLFRVVLTWVCWFVIGGVAGYILHGVLASQ